MAKDQKRILSSPAERGGQDDVRPPIPAERGWRQGLHNADLIAQGLSPFDPSAADVAAGRLMLELIEDHVAKGESFAFETTLSGLGFARSIPKWRAAGFFVVVHFLSVPSAETSIARVRRRVKQGGHDVPEPVIRRRFARGLENFLETYRRLVDAWFLYDNSGGEPVMIDKGSNDR